MSITRRVFITLVTLITTVAFAGVVAASGDHRVEYNDTDPQLRRFQTIEKAQAVVPFPIRTPAVTADAKLVSVVVETVPIQVLDRDLTRVTIQYMQPDGRPLTLILSDVAGHPTRSNVDSVADIAVNGAPGVAITAHNLSGKTIGYVYWTQGNITYRLITSEKTGLELIPLAITVTD